MEYADILVRLVFALCFVIGLIFLISILYKKGIVKLNYINSKALNKRLSIEEVAIIDAKRKLILVKRDNVEHLLLLGAGSDLLIENNINKNNNIS